MSIYCFPNPTDPLQLMCIKGIGFRENELTKLMIQMEDWEKLKTIRTSWTSGELSDYSGTLWYVLYFL